MGWLLNKIYSMRHNSADINTKEGILDAMQVITDSLEVDFPVIWAYHWSDDQRHEIRLLATAYNPVNKRLAVEGITLAPEAPETQATKIVRTAAKLENHYNRFCK